MSKKSHARAVGLNRRGLLAGAGGAVAAGALAGVPSPGVAAGVQISPDFLELCRLQPLLDAAHTGAASCKDHTPEMQAADAYCDELHALLAEISERVWARPVQTWTDVLERAAIAFFWFGRDDNNEVEDLDSENPPDRAAAELITAVMEMAEGGKLMFEPKSRKPARAGALPPEFADFEPPFASFDELRAFLSDAQQLNSRPSTGERFAAATASASMDELDKVARRLAKDKGKGLDWVVDLLIETGENLNLRVGLVYAAMAKLEVICDRVEKERSHA